MERAIDELLEDEAGRRTLGQLARERVRSRHDVADLGAAACSLIREVALPEPRRPRKGRSLGEPGRLPESAFRLEWISCDVPETAGPGETLRARVTVRNASPHVWPDVATTGGDGRFAIRMGFRWWEGGRQVGDDSGRVELPRRVAPDESITLQGGVATPARAGTYRLQVDLLQETVTWFEPAGAPRLEALVHVVED